MKSEFKKNEQLRFIRKFLCYNQYEIAPELGLQQGSYSDIERGN